MIRTKRENGSVVALIPCLILIIIIGIGAFAIDTTHNMTVRSELQNATDAGALGGARDLIDPATENNADSTALDVASQNKADGKDVSNQTKGVTVTSQCSGWDTSNNSATCTVDAQQTIGNVFARLFGHPTDNVNTHSTAIAYRSITGINPNTGFPMMVSVDTTNGNPKPLWKLNVGDKFDIFINSQKFKNAAWTSFKMKNTNANWLKDAMEMGLGLAQMKDGVFTGIDVGEDASLGNGVMAQKALADGDELHALTGDGMNLTIPVMKGDPPYNQDRTVVGFITIHVTGVDINQSGGQVEVLHAVLVKGVNKGTGGLPRVSGDPNIDNALKNISTGTVQLIQ
jgi:Flp pilus assembly protein TadG